MIPNELSELDFVWKQRVESLLNSEDRDVIGNTGKIDFPEMLLFPDFSRAKDIRMFYNRNEKKFHASCLDLQESIKQSTPQTTFCFLHQREIPLLATLYIMDTTEINVVSLISDQFGFLILIRDCPPL